MNSRWVSLRLNTILVCVATLAVALPSVNAAPPAPADPSELLVRTNGANYELSLAGAEPFFQGTGEVLQARLIDVPGSPVVIALWEELQATGATVPYYAISLDGQEFACVRETSYDLLLRYARFDPLREMPALPAPLAGDGGNDLYIVQFVTQPLQVYRDAVETLSGKIQRFLANHAYVIEMSTQVRADVESLPFVRWVGSYDPIYRLEDELRDALVDPASDLGTQRYVIQVVEPGLDQKRVVADRIEAMGGVVDALAPGGYLFDATLTQEELLAVVRMNEVFFVDRWRQPQLYMNNVRADGGANYIETVGGYTGAGVRAEVMDGGLLTSHQAFQHDPPILHGGNGTDTSHGTSTYGICFGDGTGNSNGRGLLPDGQGIFALYGFVNRYGRISQLVQSPYYAVFQTNSWGSCCTTQYGSYSQEIDNIVFNFDIVILQAQANEGSQQSDVSAWAKNNVSVGGIRHYNTLSRADDHWYTAGSIGPAADGRVKPDLSYWYDYILTTSNSGGYTSSFGGTSAATPETAGHFGLMFQMWADGIFGNPVDPGGTVFDNRPHASTAKALMINTAEQYPFSGTGHDLTRTHQGWGQPNVGNLYDLRDEIFVIDETDVLANLSSTAYELHVAPSTPALKATMVYTDPPGTTSSTQHRINDLSLKVTSPSATVYWGNNGLLAGNWSQSGGSSNTKDTVENVFVQNPEAGEWTVEVFADEINQDSHVETPEVDADYALVVTGVAPNPTTGDLDGDGDVDLDDFALFGECFAGADNPPAPSCEPGVDADFDGDGDVDLDDFAIFAQNFTGSM